MTIFSKDCPQCGKDNAAYAIRCGCGYLFDAVEDADNVNGDHEQTIQEEKLYEEYLAARAEQAASSAREATRLVASQPAHPIMAKEAERAKRAAETAKAELDTQRAKLNGARCDPAPAQATKAPQDTAPAAATRPAAAAQAAPPTTAATPRNVGPRSPAASTSAGRPATVAGGSSATLKTPSTGAAPAATSPARPGDAPASKREHANLVPLKATAPATKAAQTPARSGADAASGTDGGRTPAGDAQPIDRDKGSNLAKTLRIPSNEAQARPASPAPRPACAGGKDTKANPEHTATGKNNSPAQSRLAATTTAKPQIAAPAQHGSAATKAAAAAQAQKLAEALKAAQATRAAADAQPDRPQPPGAQSTRAAPQPPRGARLASRPGSAEARPAPATTTEVAPNAQAPSSVLAATQRARPSLNDAPLARSVEPPKPVHATPVEPTEKSPLPTRKAAPAPKKIAGTQAPRANAKNAGITKPAPAKRPECVTSAAASASKRPGEPPELPGTTQTASPRAADVSARQADDSHRTTKAAPRNGSAHAPRPELDQPAVSAPAANARQDLQAALDTLSARAPVSPPNKRTRPTPAAVAEAAADASKPAVTTPAEPPKQADTKDCPNCTAALPIDTARCRCGFAFTSVDERMPPLSLSDSDIAALDGGPQTDSITPLG
ncbi:MAG: hypothetical protein BMS9Abin10_0245 [Gammaproteobacteria bacterium]|nr:MAG: hypothetical protein BMS9Abin10_0245 [Gammaproteobacteria bacterium]